MGDLILKETGCCVGGKVIKSGFAYIQSDSV